MKKSIKIITTLSFVFSVVLMLFLTNTKDTRNLYEVFLQKKYTEYNSFSKQVSENNPKQDQPEAAAFMNYIQTVDPQEKRVPSERLFTAYKNLKQNPTKSQKTANITWENLSSDMGGRTRVIMFDPNDADTNKVWAGSVTGGLWYNNDISDFRSVWNTVDDFWENLSISSLAYDPNNTQIFYAGTGEAQTALIMYRESSSRGIGIMKSSDGGATWQHLESTSDFAYVTDVKVRNESGTSVIYAAVVSGIYKGTNHQSNPSDGLYRSENGGSSWEQVLPNIPDEDKPYAPSDIEISANGRIFVGTMKNLNNKGGATILYSDDGTFGSWTVMDTYRTQIENTPQVDNIPGRVVLACAQSNNQVLYAAISVGSKKIGIDGFDSYIGKYILKSADAGATWSEISIPDGESRNWAYLSWHALTISVDPNDENSIFAGGLDLHKSTDGGNTWHKVSDWAQMYYGGGDNYVHADQHLALYKSGSSSEMVFATDGGVFYTSSANQYDPVFEEHNINYSSLQFYSCDINQNQDNPKYIGGLQDNGTVYYSSNTITNQDMISGGDGAFCFFDDNQESLFITSVYNNVYYVFYEGDYYNYHNDHKCGLFINPADYESSTNTLYANAVTSEGNNGDSVVVLSGFPSLISGKYYILNTGNLLPYSAVTISPEYSVTNKTVFFGNQIGKLYKVNFTVTDPFPIVTEIGSSDFPTANISCIAAGSSESELLVTFSNYGVTSVWYTNDGGLSWTNKEANLPDIPVRWALFHPNNSQQALLATELGVWETTNLKDDEIIWNTANIGLANIRIDMLQMRTPDNRIVAASHGRGLFTGIYNPAISIDFSASSTSGSIGDSINFTANFSSNPDSVLWSFEGGSPNFSHDNNPLNIKYETEGIFKVTLNAYYSDTTITVVKNSFINIIGVGIKSINDNDLISIYPNPGNGIINFSIENNIDLTSIEIYSYTGQKLFTKEKLLNTKLDLSSMNNGVYFIKFYFKNNSSRVIKYVKS